MAKAKTNPKPDADGERPMAIAVLDRGWVYLGEVDYGYGDGDGYG